MAIVVVLSMTLKYYVYLFFSLFVLLCFAFTQTYINCSCITQRYVGNEGSPHLGDDVAAIHGECKKPCNLFIPYLVSYFVIMFLGPMCANPATLLKLR